MWNVSAFSRLALGVLLVTGSASVAGADIRLTESSLHASVRARVDPHTVDHTDAEADIPDPGTLRDMSVNAAASDSEAVSESVTVTGSVTFTGADTFAVHLVATRGGRTPASTSLVAGISRTRTSSSRSSPWLTVSLRWAPGSISPGHRRARSHPWGSPSRAEISGTRAILGFPSTICREPAAAWRSSR